MSPEGRGRNRRLGSGAKAAQSALGLSDGGEACPGLFLSGKSPASLFRLPGPELGGFPSLLRLGNPQGVRLGGGKVQGQPVVFQLGFLPGQGRLPLPELPLLGFQGIQPAKGLLCCRFSSSA